MNDPLLHELLVHLPKGQTARVQDLEDESFHFQLECLKIEINLVDNAIARSETITQTIKNFAVVIWAAGITAFLGQVELRKFVIIVSLIPILFWIIDASWLSFLRGAFLRQRKIQEFLNSPNLIESFRQKKLVNFNVLDVTGKQYRDTMEYKGYASVGRIMQYREMILIYAGIILFNIFIGLFALLYF